jgi:hypothetical protein
LLRARSADVTVVVGSFAVLLVRCGSVVPDVTEAEFVSVPGAWEAATLTMTVMGWAYIPLGRTEADGVVQVKTPPDSGPHVHPVPVVENSVSPAGMVSVTVRGPAASDGPRFSTLTV